MRRRGKQKGHIRRKGPSWYGYWWEWTTSATGQDEGSWRKFSKWIGPAEGPDRLLRKRAEEAFQRDVLDKLDVVNRHPTMLATLKEFVDLKFWPRAQQKYKRKGLAHYRYMLDKHVLPALGNKQLSKISLEDVEGLIYEKLNGGYSVQTGLHIRNVISALYTYAKKIKWFTGDSPVSGVELPEMQRVREKTALTREQFEALSRALTYPYREMVIVLVFTGLRIAELLGLKWGKVNLTPRPITVDGRTLPPFCALVNESYVRVSIQGQPYGQYQSVKGQNNPGRIIPLVQPVVETLQDMISRRTIEGTDGLGPEDPVFLGRGRLPVDEKGAMNRHIRPAARSLGLRIGWHDLRHTANTWAEQRGVTLTERKKIFGWTQDRMAAVYGHADLEAMREALEKVVGGVRINEREL